MVGLGPGFGEMHSHTLTPPACLQQVLFHTAKTVCNGVQRSGKLQNHARTAPSAGIKRPCRPLRRWSQSLLQG